MLANANANASTAPFAALAQRLRAAGWAAQGARLDAVLGGVWTTSGELLGALGQELLDIRRECRHLDRADRALLKACATEVRKAWPGFGWRYWLPF
jgi:hypothetical protein